MANNVFANGRELSCKSGAGKTIAEFPDVCFTPPENPATPPGVPLPYPNFGMSSDTTSGSKSVKISKKEVMIKNKSYFKKSTGDEAGCAAKKGVISSKNKGKVYFTSWSPDVKIEGENAVRHLDVTTHNHGSPANGAVPFPHVDGAAFGNVAECEEDSRKANEACADSTIDTCSEECKQKMQCILVPKGQDKKRCCQPNNTGDHLIEDHWVRPGGEVMPGFKHISNKPGGAYKGAPTMCVNASRYSGDHGVAHGIRGVREEALIGKSMNYAKAKEIALESHSETFRAADCSPGCIEAQLDAFYGKGGNKKCHTPNRKQPLKATQRADAKATISARTSTPVV